MAWHPNTSISPLLKEQSILPGTQMKPAVLFIPTWSAGKPVAIDISFVSPTQCHLLLYDTRAQTDKRRSRKHQVPRSPSHPEHHVHSHSIRNIWWMGVRRQTSFCQTCRHSECNVALTRQNHLSPTSCTKDWPSPCRGNMPEQ